jgi:outer membrane protein insertion porin family
MQNRYVLIIMGGLLTVAVSSAWSIENAASPLSTSTIHAIDFIGNKVIDSGTLEKRLSIKRDGPFLLSQVSFSRDVIKSIYQDKGYEDVHISTRTTAFAPGRMNVQFVIEEGPLYRVGAVTIQGNHLISDQLVQRDLKIAPGQPFSPTRIYEGNKSLFLSGYFESIDIHYSSATAHLMDVQVRLKERPTQYAKGGFGYGTETKERVSIGYEDRNFFGNEKQLDVSAIHSGFLTDPQKYRTTILETSLAQPHFLDTSFEGQTSVSEEWDDREAYNARTTAWRSSLGRHFGDHITASLRYRFQGTELTRIDPSASSTTLPFTDVSAIGPTFTYDNTNDPFLPTVGWRISSLLEKGLTLGAGDIAFQRFEARAGRFDTVHQVTFFGGLQFGIVRPDHPGDSIPIFERYSLGGANTVRGYEQEELGPRDAQGNPLGGNAFIVGNLEVRHMLYKKLAGVWFLDGGQLFVQPVGSEWPYIQAKSLGDFVYGTGPGLRLNTPVGAVRLELGYKLNPPGGDSDFLHRTAIDFSLGEVF